MIIIIAVMQNFAQRPLKTIKKWMIIMQIEILNIDRVLKIYLFLVIIVLLTGQ